MAESPADKYAGENKLAERFGGQTELERVVPTPSVIPASEIGQSDLCWAAGGLALTEANNEKAANASLTTQSLLQESAVNLATPEIDSRIDVQKKNLDTLLQRYTDQHPDVIATRATLAERP